MKTVIVGWIGALALFGVATSAAAEGPMRLSDAEMDRLTAGANSGAVFSVLVASGGEVLVTEQSRDNPGTGRVARTTSDNNATAELEGVFRKTDGDNYSAFLGFYTGEAEAGPGGRTALAADGLAEGSIAITQGNIFQIPGTNRYFGYSIGFGVDTPFGRQSWAPI